MRNRIQDQSTKIQILHFGFLSNKMAFVATLWWPSLSWCKSHFNGRHRCRHYPRLWASDQIKYLKCRSSDWLPPETFFNHLISVALQIQSLIKSCCLFMQCTPLPTLVICEYMMMNSNQFCNQESANDSWIYLWSFCLAKHI